MCTEMYKKMQKKRIYSEVTMRMRTSRVAQDEIGSEFIRYALMAYLHDSTLTIDELALEAMRNIPTGIHGILEDYPEEAIQLMHDALETVERRMDGNPRKAVEKFIHDIATEVKLAETLDMKLFSMEEESNSKEREVLIETAARRMNKPDESFKEILQWIAGHFNYDSLYALLAALYKFTDNSIDFQSVIADVNAELADPVETSDIFEMLEVLSTRTLTKHAKKAIKLTVAEITDEIKLTIEKMIEAQNRLII